MNFSGPPCFDVMAPSVSARDARSNISGRVPLFFIFRSFDVRLKLPSFLRKIVGLRLNAASSQELQDEYIFS